jgi:hypothetical protein
VLWCSVILQRASRVSAAHGFSCSRVRSVTHGQTSVSQTWCHLSRLLARTHTAFVGIRSTQMLVASHVWHVLSCCDMRSCKHGWLAPSVAEVTAGRPSGKSSTQGAADHGCIKA